MLNLTSRPAMLGNTINTRGENNGEETVPAKDYPISGIALTKEEFNNLVGDPHAWDALYDSGKSPVEPICTQFKPLQFKDTFKDCSAEILFGLKRDSVKVKDAKLKSVKLAPQVGGVVEMSCLLQGHVDASKTSAMLDAFLNHDIEVTLSIGELEDDSQPELPLSTHGANEEPEDGEKPRRGRRRSSNGDRPNAH